MSEQKAPYDMPLAPGTRVWEREMRADRPPRVGTVVPAPQLAPGLVAVRWDGDPSGAAPWAMRPDALIVVVPPPDRAPERALCPDIVVSADTCDGEPRIGGTRLRTDALDSYWWRELGEGHGPGTAARHVAGDHQTTPEAVARAVCFEAGRSYERERRLARKARRRARRWERGKAASDAGKGERDD